MILAAIGGLLVVHARWFSKGPKDPRFVRFLRRYDKRSNADDLLPPHGVAVDAKGQPLDVAVPGSNFQHVLDDLSLTMRGQTPSSDGQVAVLLTLDAAL